MYFANGQSQSSLFVEIMIQMMLLVQLESIMLIGELPCRHMTEGYRKSRDQKDIGGTCINAPVVFLLYHSAGHTYIYIYIHIHMELSPVNPGSGELALNAK